MIFLKRSDNNGSISFLTIRVMVSVGSNKLYILSIFTSSWIFVLINIQQEEGNVASNFFNDSKTRLRVVLLTR